MQYGELIDFLQNVGKDPSKLIFEDELTGLHNRRFLHSYFEHKIRWDREDSFPLSLLVLDVDLFKIINDTYGHDAGDEALVFVAELLKEIAGEDGYPVRFGGDEFMILFPKTELQKAVRQAHLLHQRTTERRLTLSKSKGELQISLSIGVASARTDAASGNDLIRKADTALYASKKLGRNRVSVAKDTDAGTTFSRTALHRLQDVQIAGRAAELAAASAGLSALSEGGSKLLLVEGAPGMGKSTFLESIRRSLADNDALGVVKVGGKRQEGFRPYYLAGQAIVALMNERDDKGVSVLEALDEKERHYLGFVLPHLDDRILEIEEDDAARREGVFVSLLRLLGKLLDGKPLVLLADDLHLADEGSLVLLRVLLTRTETPLFVCGTVAERVSLGKDGENPPPLHRALLSRAEELPLERIQLSPLSESHIAEHLAGVFPGVNLPAGFEAELARTTSGNPLFLSAIIRKLVLDQKLTLVGQRWTVEPPEEGYLPKSLEEIVAQKIQALDGEARKLLEHVSTLGEDVPLSMVTGATDVSENEVLEFLDRAEDLGLLQADFHINDETMRFLSKRVLEIAYGAIQPSRRQELHERVGHYQEELSQNRLGPSASILAYHFKLSANQEKASRYEQIQSDLRNRAFDSAEAEQYTGETFDDGDDGPSDEKLSPEALEKLPTLFRTLLTTVRSVQLYPPDSKPIRNAFQTSLDAVEAVLQTAEHVALGRAQGVLLANGHKVDAGEFRLLASSYLELLDRAELESIDFRRGVTGDELKRLLMHLGQLKPENIDAGYWKDFAAAEGLEHVVVRQMRYSEIRRRRANGQSAPAPQEAGLDADALSRLPHLLRALLGAVKNVKLYPLGSQQVASSLDALHDEVSRLLAGRSPLTLAGAADILLVNGVRVASTGFETLAGSFLSFMEASELSSLTFLDSVTRSELESFVGSLKALPHDLDPSFWQELVEAQRIRGIAFNDRRYALTRLQSALEAVESDPGLSEPTSEADAYEEITDEHTLVEALPQIGKDLLVKGDSDLLKKVLRRVFTAYPEQEPPIRERIVRACRSLHDALIQALQHQFASVAADFLIGAFKEEDDDHVLGELANLLYHMTGSVLQFADYPLASRIFSELRERQHELMKTVRSTGRGLAVLNRKMDASTRTLLMEELQSREPSRQEQVAQVLESMGKPSIPILIEVIKQERDFRTRQLAASLLGKMGREGAEQIKREVVLEVTAEQRFRILEVIDVVTRDLKTELAFCLSDVNPKVRRAAFRLSERLSDKFVLELLVDLARHEDIGVAKGAIRSLANLRSAHAVGALVNTLEVTKDPERAIACAQALAQLGDAVAVPALERVLTARKYPLLQGKRWDDQVRATAAFALAQIGGDRARAALGNVSDDPDPRIRQIALSGYSERPIVEDASDADEDEGDREGEGVA